MYFIKIINFILYNLSNEQYLILFPSGNIVKNNTLYSCKGLSIIFKRSSYLLTSQILLVISSEAEATKSPPECHVQDHTAWLCPSKVSMHSPFERSHNLIVVSPPEVANLLPLYSRKQEDNLFKKLLRFSLRYVHIYIYLFIYIYVRIHTCIYIHIYTVMSNVCLINVCLL